MYLMNVPEPQEPDREQDQPGHHRREDQPVHPVLLDRRRHQHDEGAGRPADLEAAAAKRRHEEAADDRRVKAPVRRDAGGDRDRHRQRQGDDGDRQPGDGVGPEIQEPVALAQDGDELRSEELGEGGIGGPDGHGRAFFCRWTALSMKKVIKKVISVTIIDVYYINHS